MIFIKKIFLASFVLIGCFIFGFSFNGVKATDEENPIWVDSESHFVFNEESGFSDNLVIQFYGDEAYVLDKDNNKLSFIYIYDSENDVESLVLPEFDYSNITSFAFTSNGIDKMYIYLLEENYSKYPASIDSNKGAKIYVITMSVSNEGYVFSSPELVIFYPEERQYRGFDWQISSFKQFGDSIIYTIRHDGEFMIKLVTGETIYQNNSYLFLNQIIDDGFILLNCDDSNYYFLDFNFENLILLEKYNDDPFNHICIYGDNYYEPNVFKANDCFYYISDDDSLFKLVNDEFVELSIYFDTSPYLIRDNLEYEVLSDNKYFFNEYNNELFILTKVSKYSTDENGESNLISSNLEIRKSKIDFEGPNAIFIDSEDFSIGNSTINIKEKEINGETINYTKFITNKQFTEYKNSLSELEYYEENYDYYLRIFDDDFSKIVTEFGFDDISHYVDYIISDIYTNETRLRLYYSCPTTITESNDLQTVIDGVDEYTIFNFNLNSLPSYDELIALMKDKFQLNECGIDGCEAYLYSIDFGDWDYPNYTNFEFENSQAKLKLSLNISDEFAVESKEFNYPLLFILTNDTQVTFGGSTKLKTTTTNKLTDAALLNMITITTTNGSINNTKVNFNEYNLKYNVPGVYPVEVAVTDNWGASFFKQLDIEVYDGQAPTFSGYSDICKSTKSVLTVNDIMAMISVIDNCTAQDKLAIKVKEDNYTGKADQKGDYKIVFSCVDESNNESTFTVNIHVKEMVDCFVFDKKIINVRKGVTITKDDIKALITDFGFIDKNTDTYVTYTGDYFDSPNSIGVHEIKVNLLTSSGKEENVSFVVNVLEDINGDKIEKELNFFEKIWKAISDFFNSIFKNISNFFKNIGKKSEVKK